MRPGVLRLSSWAILTLRGRQPLVHDLTDIFLMVRAMATLLPYQPITALFTAPTPTTRLHQYGGSAGRDKSDFALTSEVNMAWVSLEWVRSPLCCSGIVVVARWSTPLSDQAADDVVKTGLLLPAGRLHRIHRSKHNKMVRNPFPPRKKIEEPLSDWLAILVKGRAWKLHLWNRLTGECPLFFHLVIGSL